MPALPVGSRFTHLVVEAEDRSTGKLRWRCKCDCGSIKLVAFTHLSSGKTKSCGCLLRKTRNGARPWVPEIHIWQKMKDRCANENFPQYQDYGGRGIKVCERWIESFDNFLCDMGSRPSQRHTLDHIDVNGNYEPGNVRWATYELQARNKRDSVCALSVILIRFMKRRSPKTRNEDIGHAFGVQRSAISKIYRCEVTPDAFAVLKESMGW